jgi:hypothetical protein
MANTSIFSSPSTRVGALRFDGTIKEEHHYSLTLTNNPVEFGANITDNAFVNPTEVKLDVIVGDVYASIGQPTNYNPSKRSSDALRKLYKMMSDRKTITVICNLAKYTNLMLVDVMTSQSKANSSTLIATLTFNLVLVVDSNSGSIVVDNNNDQYQQPQNSGTKQLNPKI